VAGRRIVVTGGTGLIGNALVASLRERGDDVVVVGRGSGDATWDPAAGELDPSLVGGVDAVVNLNGAGVADKRWTDERKALILRSRVDSTRLLADTIASVVDKPSVFVSGSAIGYYGDTGDIAVDESAPEGDGFLASVVAEWEAVALPARQAGVRTPLARTGIVLSKSGGALGPLMPLFKVGLGGPIGRGKQWWSWITIRDEIRALEFLLDGDLDGPVNLTAPIPVRQSDFAKAMGSEMGRPAVVPAPKFALDLRLGRELAGSIGYGSQRVLPVRLENAGFEFSSDTVQAGLKDVFG
jgi:uncharacterized protein (TIGR01777 family)